MINHLKPYLVIPKLIRQNTWGGDYIATEKGIEFPVNEIVKLGQSYELFSGTKLSMAVSGKEYEVGFADRDEIDMGISPKSNQSVSLAEMTKDNPELTLGKTTLAKGKIMPLLLKLTQAKGNSFQLHIKPGLNDPKWLPKSETWYFFEKGRVTCGIADGISIKDYQNCCIEIDKQMQSLSKRIAGREMMVEEARMMAQKFIKEVDPWQFVQTKEAGVGEIFDMSKGGIHHSWEENMSNSRGNILYEIQEDRMDPVSTIRAFDQGKIDDKGNIRKLDIDDYFKYLDASEELNQGNFSGKKSGGNNVFTTKDYAMDKVEIEKNRDDSTTDSFCHYYVKNGKIKIETGEGQVVVEKGWSCFVPAGGAIKVKMESLEGGTVLLKTYVPETNR